VQRQPRLDRLLDVRCIQQADGPRARNCLYEPSTSCGTHDRPYGAMNLSARLLAPGTQLKPTCTRRALATPSPAIAVHQRRRCEIRTVRPASVRVPCAHRAATARGCNQRSISSAMCGTKSRPVHRRQSGLLIHILCDCKVERTGHRVRAFAVQRNQT
jgi:hypothetical protein